MDEQHLEQSANQMHDEAQDREDRDDLGTHDDGIHVHRKILTASQQKEADAWDAWFNADIAKENENAQKVKELENESNGWPPKSY